MVLYNYPFPVLINDTVNPNIGFRGFVVQAQSVPGENLIGIFLVNSAQFQQYLDCRDSLGNIAMVSTIAERIHRSYDTHSAFPPSHIKLNVISLRS